MPGHEGEAHGNKDQEAHIGDHEIEDYLATAALVDCVIDVEVLHLMYGLRLELDLGLVLGAEAGFEIILHQGGR